MTFAPLQSWQHPVHFFCLDVYHCFAVGNFIGKVGLKDKPPRALRESATSHWTKYRPVLSQNREHGLVCTCMIL